MKFLAGFITGAALTILVLYIYSTNSDDTLVGLNISSEKGECITKKELKIIQVIKPSMALAEFGEFPNETIVLLVDYEKKSYYDGLKISIPINKCAIQIGTYQYQTKLEFQKTVPAVIIE
jgi:hypothetical protein